MSDDIRDRLGQTLINAPKVDCNDSIKNAKYKVFPAVGSIWLDHSHDRRYKVLYAGCHTETGEALVVYQAIGDDAPVDPDDVLCMPRDRWRSLEQMDVLQELELWEIAEQPK